MVVKIVVITEYYWGGKRFGFKIKSHCEECTLIRSMIEDMLKKEFKGKDIKFVEKPWLTYLFEALSKGIYHPPGLTLNGKKIFQYSPKQPILDKKNIERKVNVLLSK
ncbi:hypothetical protein HYT56_03275 [Candidatus Woesearchaeota archaeon]|nr:hypothetical protein [Candidatus Woesearchaeota archaeon]